MEGIIPFSPVLMTAALVLIILIVYFVFKNKAK